MLRPFTLKIFLSRLQEIRSRFQRGLDHAARIVAQIQHQPLQLLPAQLLDGVLQLLRGLRIESVHPNISDAGLQ